MALRSAIAIRLCHQRSGAERLSASVGSTAAAKLCRSRQRKSAGFLASASNIADYRPKQRAVADRPYCNLTKRLGRTAPAALALSVGADEHDRPAGQPRLAVVQAVTVHLVELKAVDRGLLESAESQSGGKHLGLTG
jgi:hypothetical protein